MTRLVLLSKWVLAEKLHELIPEICEQMWGQWMISGIDVLSTYNGLAAYITELMGRRYVTSIGRLDELFGRWFRLDEDLKILRIWYVKLHKLKNKRYGHKTQIWNTLYSFSFFLIIICSLSSYSLGTWRLFGNTAGESPVLQQAFSALSKHQGLEEE
jgi:hypothetical protein